MRFRALMFVCLTICLVCLVLTGVTVARWHESYRSLTAFRIELVAVCETEDPTGFDVHLLIINDGEVDVTVARLSLLLDWENRLIASAPIHPDDLVVRSGEEQPFSTVLTSSLPADRRPTVQGCVTEGPWSVRMEMVLEHPTRAGRFVLRRVSALDD